MPNIEHLYSPTLHVHGEVSIARPTVAAGDSELTLNWTDPIGPVGTIESINIEFRPDNLPDYTAVADVEGLSYQFEGLTNGQRYVFRIKVNFSQGQPLYSALAYGIPRPESATFPLLMGVPMVLDPGDGQLTVRWISVDDAAYEIRYSRSGGTVETTPVIQTYSSRRAGLEY